MKELAFNELVFNVLKRELQDENIKQYINYVLWWNLKNWGIFSGKIIIYNDQNNLTIYYLSILLISC